MYDEILYSVDDPVALITLNRPQRLNAWTRRMAAEVRHAVYRAECDRSVVGIVLTGSGRAFCAGADMENLKANRQGRPSGTEDFGYPVTPTSPPPPDFDGAYTWLMAIRKPIVAAINGPIAGMAVPIALACDIRFMASDAPLVTAFADAVSSANGESRGYCHAWWELAMPSTFSCHPDASQEKRPQRSGSFKRHSRRRMFSHMQSAMCRTLHSDARPRLLRH